jgi:acyl transferase domain-containing protein/NAD(P)H-dependent flavin oxidoreductase YrpB (nitropropane dioxygenase family)/NAD(P)-dependent dehydrogenase (short-subunit alcohol dehydrogenase family)/acyl carrier protein
VFESLHWLTNLVNIAATTRTKISRLHLDDTQIVGLNLQAPYRLFNRGNSKAAKNLQRFAGSLCGSEIQREQQRFFADRIEKGYTHPLESKFERDELLPLGTETAFAGSFVARFGPEFCSAVAHFKTAIEMHCQTAVKAESAFINSRMAADLGTLYPFIQGAMTWITDVPDFARAVAEAGALPTIALGMMRASEIRQKLANLKQIMQDRPFAVNVICLPENPYLPEQLEWIKQTKPCFAVIAAGAPRHAAALLRAGIDVVYIAAGTEMIRMAFNEGIRYVICEGTEAGGHIGRYSTLSFAQAIQDIKHWQPALFADCRVILAGGICDRETAFMAALLGADALQLGTAYLATEEIVETGALTRLYQRLITDSKPGSTVVSGEAAGLRVRSLSTPKMNAICSLERDYAAGSADEVTIRRKIEALSAGSLLVAARGIDGPGGKPLAESICLERGQFMSGACAGLIDRVQTLAELHRELALAPLQTGEPILNPFSNQLFDSRPKAVSAGAQKRATAVLPATEKRDKSKERIAITGMSIVNSLGTSPEGVWAASKSGASGIIEVPASKWDHTRFYDPRPQTPEKTYCKVAAFQHLEITRKELGIPPQDFRTMSYSTKATLWLAKKALEDSGLLAADIARERVGVFISQNSGEAAGTLQDVIIRGSVDKIITAIKKIIPIPEAMEQKVAAAITSRRLAIDDTTLLGRLNCTAAGFICNAYGFQGPSFAVSAACASSLVALYNAYHLIRNGTLDAALVGGAEELLTPLHFLEFSALGALAGLSGLQRPPEQTSRPFDSGRDGMVLGEGGGIIILEKESLAKKRHARIHGYVSAMGASNNNLGMVESSRSTQELAIRASYDQAGYGPDQVDLVECHATATVQGDIEEVRALHAVFNSDHPTILTSFKSQIGHTLGASGVNSLIRALKAAKEGIFPATLNFDNEDPVLSLNKLRFHILTEPVDWKLPSSRPRRFQVNSFGFGGSNYVLQVELPLDNDKRSPVLTNPISEKRNKPELPATLPQELCLYRTKLGDRWYRMAHSADIGNGGLSQIIAAELAVPEKALHSKHIRSLARKGVFLGPEKGIRMKMGFVFPGQGSYYPAMGYELYRAFPVIQLWLDRLADLADFDLLSVLFHQDEKKLQKTRWQQPALFALEYAIAQYLISVGLRPAALAGHSLGELTALCLAEVFSYKDGYRIINRRAICMEKACNEHEDPGIMMATDAPLDYLQRQIGPNEDLYITNINSPRQVVFGGTGSACRDLSRKLESRGFRCTQLRVSMAFHSPIMKCVHDELEAFISQIEFHPPRIPVISNTTCKHFPANPREIKRIVMAHLETPVHWMHNVQTLRGDCGIGLFVEIGPGNTLCDMITDTLEDVDCVQTCLARRESRTLKSALAKLYAAGYLSAPKKPETIFFNASPKEASDPAKPDTVAAIAAKPAWDFDSRLSEIVQRQINAFIVERFGRFLKPQLLAALRREYDPHFSEKNLDIVMDRLLPEQGNPQAILLPSLPGHSGLSPAAEMGSEIRNHFKSQSNKAHQYDIIIDAVIRIIMDATGYERDEIQPDMDLRVDLAIRSSRLPIILDALENHFQISIEMALFADVRTIRDLAARISRVLDNPKETLREGHRETLIHADHVEKKEPLRRIVFRQVPSAAQDFKPLRLDPLEKVVIFGGDGKSANAEKAAKLLHRDYGITSHRFPIWVSAQSSDQDQSEIRSRPGKSGLLHKIDKIGSLSGLIFIVDDAVDAKAGNPQEIAVIAKFFFDILKIWINSPAKKFALLLHFDKDPHGCADILREAVTGMFLSLAHEFPAALFRAIKLDESTPLRIGLRGALNRSQSALELIYETEKVYTVEGREQPIIFKPAAGLVLKKGDVIVFSGGYGITPYLARAFIAEGCKIVLIGRTMFDSESDRNRITELGCELRKNHKPPAQNGSKNLDPAVEEPQSPKVSTSAAVRDTLQALKAMGADVTYVCADVTNFGKLKTTLAEIHRKFGQIAGIVHGAGILRDVAAEQMTALDFEAVFDVKYLGAWYLYQAAKDLGLKFFVALSSGAAILGNAGQVNYAAANRSMAALMKYINIQDEFLFTKALMLAPIEGAGMAESSQMRAIFKRLGAGFIHINELTELIAREVYLAGNDDPWVMLMRNMPAIDRVRIKTAGRPDNDQWIQTGSLIFAKHEFPMIDRVRKTDLNRGELVAEKSFSVDRDLWIADHKPFKFLNHPLVSGIMVLEAFTEAASILVPYLQVKGAKDVLFLDMLECPPGTEPQAEIVCRVLRGCGNEVVCELFLKSSDDSTPVHAHPSYSLRHQAKILLGRRDEFSAEMPVGFPIRAEEINSRPLKRNEILEKYQQRTDMRGRYRLMQEFEGTGDGLIRGRFIYRQTDDFNGLKNTTYQFSPYTLEAMMQAVNFYVIMRNESESRSMIPRRIGELHYLRNSTEGEIITVEARMIRTDDSGIIWNARAVDADGRILMVAKEMEMSWFF